jgi:hypothetical protein
MAADGSLDEFLIEIPFLRARQIAVTSDIASISGKEWNYIRHGIVRNQENKRVRWKLRHLNFKEMVSKFHAPPIWISWGREYDSCTKTK